MPNAKILPDTMLTVQGGREPVAKVIIHPDGRFPEQTPIRKDLGLCAIEVVSPTGHRRWYGSPRAWIGSDLRIHMVPVGDRDEVIRKWEDSGEQPPLDGPTMFFRHPSPDVLRWDLL